MFIDRRSFFGVTLAGLLGGSLVLLCPRSSSPSPPLVFGTGKFPKEILRIDDHIQASQERFFENGIFPSVKLEVDPRTPLLWTQVPLWKLK